MSRDVYVIGVGMHPFGKHGRPPRDMAFDAATAALDDAGISFREIESLYNGYLADRILAGVTYAKDLGLTGVPVTHVENASATGSSAFREAVLAVRGGACDVAMALGFDGTLGRGPTRLGGQRSRGPRGVEGLLLPAGFFAMWAVRRMHEVGTKVETFARIAAKNWNHARHNPMAERRAEEPVTVQRVLDSPLVAYPHTTMMCCATGGGAAGAVVATEAVARRVARGRKLVKVSASQLRSEEYTEGHVFLGAVVGPAELTRTTARRAYEEAGVGPEDLSLVHVHDAFPIEELMYYELLGICADGEGDRLVEEGATEIGGRIPFSTDGGLIARGHPGGPTGLAQIWDIVQQLRGESGPRQVEGARIGLAHMMGAGSVCAIHILERGRS